MRAVAASLLFTIGKYPPLIVPCLVGNGAASTRMIHDGRHKLIYYPVGNRSQLFDLAEDPEELRDLSQAAPYEAVRQRLEQALAAELYGGDEAWARDGRLVGLPEQEWSAGGENRGLSGQRGGHFPPPSR